MSEPAVAVSDGQPKRILLVEDEPLLRIAMVDDLIAAGFEVITAAHADEALRVLQTSIPFDVLVTDITMPGGSIDGLELAARVRVKSPHIKIVIASAYISGGFRSDVADAWLGKPDVLYQLADLVWNLLRDARHGSQIAFEP